MPDLPDIDEQGEVLVEKKTKLEKPKLFKVLLHNDDFTTMEAARRAIGGFAIAPLATPIVSAHVMGGCPIGSDPKRAVVDMSGRHNHLANLHVIDGSLFPTSIGANPQLSIYAVAAKLSDALATSLGRKARAA